MTKKLNDDDAYETLVKWCEKQGWEVIEGPGLLCQAEEGNLITIGRLVVGDYKIYSLLHEIGHLKIWNSENFNIKYIGYGRAESHRYHRVAVVEEEIKAWDEGLLLAQELNISIDITKYTYYKYDNVYAYIGWVKNPKRYDYIGYRKLKDE